MGTTLGHGASGEAQSSDICQQNGGGGLISHPGPGCLFRGKINRSMPFHVQAVYKVCRLDQGATAYMRWLSEQPLCRERIHGLHERYHGLQQHLHRCVCTMTGRSDWLMCAV